MSTVGFCQKSTQTRVSSDVYYQSKYGRFDHGTGVKSDDRKRHFGEVLTPRWVVEMMLDLVPDVRIPDVTVFEPACGEGAFITCVLRRKLSCARTDDERVRACQTCYGIDIQSDNVEICRARLTAIARDNGVDADTAARIFVRNVVHGDMLFFPMLARFYDWENGTWTTLEDMAGGEIQW